MTVTLELPDARLPVAPAARRIGFLARAVLRTARGVPRRLLSPATRTPEIVAAEYDLGAWRLVLDARRWERVERLDDLLVPEQNKLAMRLVEGRLVEVDDRTYYEYRARKLEHMIKSLATDTTRAGRAPLVELGSGWGMNLFTLLARGWKGPLAGYEVSRHGVEASRAIAARFNAPIAFEQADMLRNEVPIEGATVFTYYSLEQLKPHIFEVLERIRAWRPARVVHIEPTYELYRRLGLREALSRDYVRQRDYLDSIVGSVRRLESAGRAHILRAQRLGYAANPLNEATCVVWEPRQVGS